MFLVLSRALLNFISSKEKQICLDPSWKSVNFISTVAPSSDLLPLNRDPATRWILAAITQVHDFHRWAGYSCVHVINILWVNKKATIRKVPYKTLWKAQIINPQLSDADVSLKLSHDLSLFSFVKVRNTPGPACEKKQCTVIFCGLRIGPSLSSIFCGLRIGPSPSSISCGLRIGPSPSYIFCRPSVFSQGPHDLLIEIYTDFLCMFYFMITLSSSRRAKGRGERQMDGWWTGDWILSPHPTGGHFSEPGG